MSKSNAQIDPVDQWMGDAKERLKDWGAYYRAGFSKLWHPSVTTIARTIAGEIQQPLNPGRFELENENDELDHIISKLPDPMKKALKEYYGVKLSLRNSAVRADMNLHAYRDLLGKAESAVAMGLSQAK